jgi:sarcosine oxidase subunit alpha
MVGQETDGSVTPLDLGLVVAPDKDFLGRRSLNRSDAARLDRKQLVGLMPDDPNTVVPEGAQIVAAPSSTAMIGHVTSSYFGARIGRGFALALVAGGRARQGEPVWAWHAGRTIAARLCSPVFYNPEGRRRDG